ncbi:MAG TPA: FtsX-like permease family protein [Gammaproteobacteria bacterium]|nr:FtsX-like permease family protein [Gammaproteobacteria bacterium]
MTRLLGLASFRFYLRHPWQLGLALAGISLGVGVFVGVELANDSAARAFDLSAALVRGAASHRLVPIGTDLDETVYRTLVLDRGVANAAPVIETDVGVAGRTALRVPLLGVDPTQEGGLRDFAAFAPGREGGNLVELMTEPGTVLLPSGLATELGAGPGTTLTLLIGGHEAPVRVLGVVGNLGRDVQAEPPILADIATAQELLGRPGRITRIDLRLTDKEAAELAATPPPGTILVPAGEQHAAFDELARAFRTNLTALGLLALVVGTFLIYSTMSFAILQRRATLGVLRALGVTPGELLGSVLVEAAALAAVATGMGLLLGQGLAVGLVDLVLRTVGDIYFSAGVQAARPSPWIYVQGAALGTGATLLAGLKPAIEAARSAPAAVLRRAALERGAQHGAARAAWLALPLLVASWGILAVGPKTLVAAFGGLFAVLAAGALLTPLATVWLMRGLDRAFGRFLGLPVVLAIRGVGASLSRTGVATAALAVAIATVNGVGLMIGSFRTSFGDWLESTLTADVYVSVDPAAPITIDPAALATLERLPGVAGVSLTRALVVPTSAGEVTVRAFRPGTRGFGLTIVGAVADSALAEVAAGRGVAASERLMFARHLEVGDEIVLPSPTGPQRLPIVGAFRDFNTGNYSIVMALQRYRDSWSDDGITGVGVDLREVADESAVTAEIGRVVGGGVRIRSSSGIRQLSLDVFDRTFRITEVLRLLAAVVAFLGVLSALLAIELERGRELGVLRALGFTPRDLATSLLVQTGLLGLAAGFVAMPLGTALAALLVHVINRRSFGWTMDFAPAVEPLAAGLALAVGAALLAGVYPSWRAGRGVLGNALREE